MKAPNAPPAPVVVVFSNKINTYRGSAPPRFAESFVSASVARPGTTISESEDRDERLVLANDSPLTFGFSHMDHCLIMDFSQPREFVPAPSVSLKAMTEANDIVERSRHVRISLREGRRSLRKGGEEVFPGS